MHMSEQLPFKPHIPERYRTHKDFRPHHCPIIHSNLRSRFDNDGYDSSDPLSFYRDLNHFLAGEIILVRHPVVAER